MSRGGKREGAGRPRNASGPDRFRNFAIVFYLDSAPEQWLDIIIDWHVEAYLSPYHDHDVNPDGEPKKPHYHLLLTFEGKKSLEQVQVMSDELSGTPPEIVNSIRGYARYLCHMDNPEKYQYSVNEVRSFSGGDYHNVIGLPSDRYKVLDDIITYCRQYYISSYSDIIHFCQDSGKGDWLRVAMDNTIFLTGYFKSLRYSTDQDVISHLRDADRCMRNQYIKSLGLNEIPYESKKMS